MKRRRIHLGFRSLPVTADEFRCAAQAASTAFLLLGILAAAGLAETVEVRTLDGDRRPGFLISV